MEVLCLYFISSYAEEVTRFPLSSNSFNSAWLQKEIELNFLRHPCEEFRIQNCSLSYKSNLKKYYFSSKTSLQS